MLQLSHVSQQQLIQLYHQYHHPTQNDEALPLSDTFHISHLLNRAKGQTGEQMEEKSELILIQPCLPVREACLEHGHINTVT